MGGLLALDYMNSLHVWAGRERSMLAEQRCHCGRKAPVSGSEPLPLSSDETR